MFIPDELIVEVLKRLPAKSLLRFMSVSKSWYSLIKNPSFISYHFNHQINQQPKLFLYTHLFSNEHYVYTDNENFDMHLQYTTSDKRFFNCGTVTTVPCCNGIYCMMESRVSFVLWNIFLRKSLDLIVPHCPRSHGKNSTYWFGFDEVSNDYKLVWFAYSRHESSEIRPFGVYIYSLNERTWRCVNASFSLNEGWLGYTGLYLNGVIYWVFDRTHSYGIFYTLNMPEMLLTFSLADETFGVCNLPSEIVYVEPSHDYTGPDDAVHLMTVKRGCKNCLVAVHRDKTNLNYWVMEEEGIQESWIKDFSIINNRDRDTIILYARMNGEIVMDLLGLAVSFDPRLTTMNPLSSVTEKYLRYAGNYMESLVLLL